MVVSEDDGGSRRAAQVFRDGRVEAVVVEKYRIEGLFKELGGEMTLEVVVPEIKILESGHGDNSGGERTDEAVVAGVQLVEEGEAG
ncbi:hypothetical protein IEQ34_003304 [Dendrobium chrysotoxum]|uniref:Uncharacterized protein n=1 Tax=Dendrobium chrysotoxum TaxID=161865 RepID=A0AAV7HGR3_DENCH|nr:hypothetical protein IEQ34_003304 [Dendrobium chrysotoxum]